MGITGTGKDVLRFVADMFADGADIDGPVITKIECLNVRQDDLSDVTEADLFWHLVDWLAENDESCLQAHTYSKVERGNCIAAIELWSQDDKANPLYTFWIYGIRPLIPVTPVAKYVRPAPVPPRKAIVKKAKRAVKASGKTYFRARYGRVLHIVSPNGSKTFCDMATKDGKKTTESDWKQGTPDYPICDNCFGAQRPEDK